MLEPRGVTVETGEKLDPTRVAELYEEHAQELHRFLRGVLRDDELASELCQVTFVKVIECGHEVRPESFKAWLFQVGFRQAMEWKRRGATWARVREQQRPMQQARERDMIEPAGAITQREMVEQVQQAIAELPAEQEEVLRLKLGEEMTLAQIAERLNIPPGTAATRFRLGLKRLQDRFRADDDAR